MSSSQAVVEQICDAVVLELNKTTWAQTFRAVRQNLPRFKREELAELTLRVAPRKRANTIATRGALKVVDFVVGVAIYKGLASYDDAEIDPLMLICEQIGEHFPTFKMTTDAGQVMTCLESSQGDDETPLFDVRKVDTLFQFAALVNLSFKGAR